MSLRTDLEDPEARDRETKAAGLVKGESACNRSACQAPLDMNVRFFNQSTRAHYCRSCAQKINRAAGYTLCLPVGPGADLHSVNPTPAIQVGVPPDAATSP